MKRKLYLRIRAFALVLLIMLTTFVVNPQQVQAETTVDGEEESALAENSAESQTDSEQTDVETQTTENTDIPPESDNEASPETENSESLSEQTADQVDESESLPEQTADKIDESESLSEQTADQVDELDTTSDVVATNSSEAGVGTRAAGPERNFEFDPPIVTRYIKANSIIRSAPNGSVITITRRPLFVSGTIAGAWLKFTYNGNPAYVAISVTTTDNPVMTGYAKSAVNVRNASGGSVIGTIPKGYRVQGVLVGNRVRFTYNGQTGYIYVSLLQATPVKVTTYIKANSIIRSAPNGSMITKLWRPILVNGTIEGAWLKFTYNGRTAYVAMSITTTSNPAMTGYAKQTLYVRNTPNGNVAGTLPKGYRVSGVLAGNMVRFTYKGQTGYVYAVLLQGTPVKVTTYIKANSIIRSAPNGSIITKTWRPLFVTGTIAGAWLKFTYNGRTAYVAMSITTTSNPAMTGYAKQKVNVRNAPDGSVVDIIPIGNRIKGVLVKNMVKFTYKGKTCYVYASLLQGTPVNVTRYIRAGSVIRSTPDGTIITTLKKSLRITGIIQENWLKFTYNGRTAYVERYPVSGYGVNVDSNELSFYERELADLVNAHRRSIGKPELKISKSLTKLARYHVIDSNEYYSEGAPVNSKGQEGNGHSWSGNVPDIWSEVIYTADHAQAQKMWDKPKEVTGYPGYGFEISFLGAGASAALYGWLNSPEHRAVIENTGIWESHEFDCMGIGIGYRYAHIWFGREPDPAGYY
jgi:uncharacterized protein YgiM (DUF1202 family)